MKREHACFFRVGLQERLRLFVLTHLYRMDFSTSALQTGPFPVED